MGGAQQQVRQAESPAEPVTADSQFRQGIHLNAEVRTFSYTFVAPRDGTYTAGLKGVDGVNLKLQITARGLRTLMSSGEGVQRLEFEVRRGVSCHVRVETVPAGAVADTFLMIFSGSGRRARPLILREDMSLALPPGPRDSIVPLVVRLAERHLENVRDKNEFDEAFEEALRQHPEMSNEKLATFVQNYHRIPAEVIRQRFDDPTPERPRGTALRREDVVRIRRNVMVATAQFTATLAFLPRLQEVLPALPQGGAYLPGDRLTIIGSLFSSNAIENQIWLTMPDKGPDGSFIRRERVTPDTATTTELSFQVPAVVPGLWSLYVETPVGRTTDVPLPIGVVAHTKPVITGIDPENMEPGMRINLRGTGFRLNPMVILIARDPAPIRGEFRWINCVSNSSTFCVAQLPQDMTAGTYDIQIEGEHTQPSSNFSDPCGYNVEPGRYQIVFENIECIHPRHDLWDRDADLVTTWATIVDESAWSKASSKYSDIGGGHPPVPYGASDGNVFTCIPENYMGFQDVRYGLVMATELYDWGGDEPANNLARDISAVGTMVGAVFSIASPVVGGAIATVAGMLAGAIPEIAKMFGYGATVALSNGGPNKNYWTAQELQTMEPGTVLPPRTEPPYVMKFGYGQYADKYFQAHACDPPGGYDVQWEWNSTGDWRVTWRISRGSVR